MTYEELMDRAYGYSTKNQPDELATEDPELLNVVRRIFEALYTIGASIRPSFYGTETAQPGSSGGWDVPAEADTIFYVENPAGDEVVLVPYDEKDAEPKRPSVYPMGQRLFPTTGSLPDPDPTGDNLTIAHTVAPTDPSAITDQLPSEYPENHYELPILQTALYLTTKDIGGRASEAELLSRERNKRLARYVSMLENRYPTTRTRYSSPKRVQDESLVSFRELLTGAIGGGS